MLITYKIKTLSLNKAENIKNTLNGLLKVSAKIEDINTGYQMSIQIPNDTDAQYILDIGELCGFLDE